MAGFELKAGAHLTILSSEEMHKEVDRLGDLFSEILRQEEGETVVRSAPPFKTTSSGKGTGDVFRVPVGYDAFMTRLVVTWPTAVAKTGGTACTLLVCADSVSAASTRAVNNTVPSVFDASRSHAPLFRGGQRIVVSLVTGPHTKTVFCSVQVVLVKRRTAAVDVEAMET